MSRQRHRLAILFSILGHVALFLAALITPQAPELENPSVPMEFDLATVQAKMNRASSEFLPPIGE